MTPLKKHFDHRDQLVEYVAHISPHTQRTPPSPFRGGLSAAQERMEAMDPVRYATTRNHIEGAVTRLSPYIRHGIVTLDHIRNQVLASHQKPAQVEKFIQELAWRDYWQRLYVAHPEWIWKDIEPYKTGFDADDYSDALPSDIQEAATDVACINHFIRELYTVGYLHNHARMYIASYLVHWRRIKWQVGAQWMLHHLIDGDPASNNLSWQWIASTFSHKPYIFNLENVRKYSPDSVNTCPDNNVPINETYENLSLLLFPNKKAAT